MRVRLLLQNLCDTLSAGRCIHLAKDIGKPFGFSMPQESLDPASIQKLFQTAPQLGPKLYLARNGPLLGFSDDPGVEDQCVGQFDRETHERHGSKMLPTHQYPSLPQLHVLLHQALQHPYIALLVAGLVNGGLGDKGAVVETRIVEQPAEGFDADGSLADVLVAIKL